MWGDSYGDRCEVAVMGIGVGDNHGDKCGVIVMGIGVWWRLWG